MERKAGQTRYVLKIMFPGYVLIQAQMQPEIYYQLKTIPDCIRVLNNGENCTRIPENEINLLLSLVDDNEVVDISRFYIQNTRVTIVAGPLKGKEGLIKAVDRRKNRAKIGLEFMGIMREVEVGIEVLKVLK